MALLSACGTESVQGEVLRAYQQADDEGMVQTYIEVGMDDGEEIRVSLPQDEAIWQTVIGAEEAGGHLRVEVKRGGAGGNWRFVRIVDSPSVKDVAAATARVVAIAGVDEVFWTSGGEVYHLCLDAPGIQAPGDGQILSGTVGDAYAAGKQRLTLRVEDEMAQCGFDTVDPGLG